MCRACGREAGLWSLYKRCASQGAGEYSSRTSTRGWLRLNLCTHRAQGSRFCFLEYREWLHSILSTPLTLLESPGSRDSVYCFVTYSAQLSPGHTVQWFFQNCILNCP